MKGCSAYNFVLRNRNLISEITYQQQLSLFISIFEELSKDVERICKKKSVVMKYHPQPNISPTLAWDNIPDKIKDVLIDLRYRGDYNDLTRPHLQKLAYAGDLMGFGRMIADRSIWSFVPKDRFKRRVDFYENN